jgi:hypothetical protein
MSSRTTKELYLDDDKLVYAPKIDVSKYTNMGGMFCRCDNLEYVPLLDTSSMRETMSEVGLGNFRGMF